jgi:hypothetical protein
MVERELIERRARRRRVRAGKQKNPQNGPNRSAAHAVLPPGERKAVQRQRTIAGEKRQQFLENPGFLWE